MGPRLTYLAGYWVGDGHSYQGKGTSTGAYYTHLHGCDKDRPRVELNLKHEGWSPVFRAASDWKGWVLYLDRSFADRMKGLGFTLGLTARTHKLPDTSLWTDLQKRGFVTGLFDADGCAHLSKGRDGYIRGKLVIDTMSESLALGVMKILEEYNLSVHLTRDCAGRCSLSIRKSSWGEFLRLFPPQQHKRLILQRMCGQELTWPL